MSYPRQKNCSAGLSRFLPAELHAGPALRSLPEDRRRYLTLWAGPSAIPFEAHPANGCGRSSRNAPRVRGPRKSLPTLENWIFLLVPLPPRTYPKHPRASRDRPLPGRDVSSVSALVLVSAIVDSLDRDNVDVLGFCRRLARRLRHDRYGIDLHPGFASSNV